MLPRFLLSILFAETDENYTLSYAEQNGLLGVKEWLSRKIGLGFKRTLLQGFCFKAEEEVKQNKIS